MANEQSTLQAAQYAILRIVAAHSSEVYLVGGTALAMHLHHRESEDLDFFSVTHARRMHQAIVRHIRTTTGYTYNLVEERKQTKSFMPYARHEFIINRTLRLKIDFVKDPDPLLDARLPSGLASMDDIYYRKILATAGRPKGISVIGTPTFSGRHMAKDVFDLWYLSEHYAPLSEWFPRHCDRAAYERLNRWLRSLSRPRMTSELLDNVKATVRVDTKRIWQHLDRHILDILNRTYTQP